MATCPPLFPSTSLEPVSPTVFFLSLSLGEGRVPIVFSTRDPPPDRDSPQEMKVWGALCNGRGVHLTRTIVGLGCNPLKELKIQLLVKFR